MFDNVLNQSAADLLTSDIKSAKLPGAILFSGPESSGKLTTALETARVLSCRGKVPGAWNCTCPSCLRHKAMVSPNVLVAGPGDCTLEISAARNTLLFQNAQNSSHLEAARYLYIRAVRKLTVRFSPVLWEGEDKLAKFTPLIQAIDENLELLSPGRTLPDGDELEKILDEIDKNCEKLESSFLYDSLPVSQIRNFSVWAHLTSNTGKKVLIIENVDRMADSSRNALLKILEEPPENTMFILTTAKREAVLPTILSRVRTYNFFERTVEQQRNVVTRVFHYVPFAGDAPVESVNGFLQTYLPVKPELVKEYAASFFKMLSEGHVPDTVSVCAGCLRFEPRVLLKIFLQGIVECQKPLSKTAAGAECSARIMAAVRKAYNDVSVYNQNPEAALEVLARSVLQVNHLSGGVLQEIFA